MAHDHEGKTCYLILCTTGNSILTWANNTKDVEQLFLIAATQQEVYEGTNL